MIDKDALIQALAVHGVLIGKDDPLLNLLVVHQVLLDEYQQMYFQGLDTLQINIGQAAEQELTKSKKLGEKIVTQALNAMSVRFGEVQEKMIAALDTEREKSRVAGELFMQDMRWIMWVTVGAAVIGLFSLVAALFLLF